MGLNYGRGFPLKGIIWEISPAPPPKNVVNNRVKLVSGDRFPLMIEGAGRETNSMRSKKDDQPTRIKFPVAGCGGEKLRGASRVVGVPEENGFPLPPLACRKGRG
jgi:hypothetical protein